MPERRGRARKGTGIEAAKPGSAENAGEWNRHSVRRAGRQNENSDSRLNNWDKFTYTFQRTINIRNSDVPQRSPNGRL